MISTGTLEVLAALRDGPDSWDGVKDRVDLSPSATYENLTQLHQAGVLDAEPVERNGAAVLQYRLTNEAVADAAVVLLEEVVA